MALSVSSPRNSPTISMVSTSESETLGAGPRWRRRRSLMRSSMRQKTATMKVLRSTARDLHFASIGLVTIERREVSLVIQPFRETRTRGKLSKETDEGAGSAEHEGE